MPIAPPESPAGAPGAPYKPSAGNDVTVLTDSSGDVLVTGGDDLGGVRLKSANGTKSLTVANSGVAVNGPFLATTIGQVSPAGITTAGALSTQQFVSGTGAQVSTAGDVEVHTPVTFNPGVATTATCAVAISPDNVTYSALATWTVPVGVALDGTIQDVTVRVPAGWYLKLTVNAQAVLGLSTYY